MVHRIMHHYATTVVMGLVATSAFFLAGVHQAAHQLGVWNGPPVLAQAAPGQVGPAGPSGPSDGLIIGSIIGGIISLVTALSPIYLKRLEHTKEMASFEARVAAADSRADLAERKAVAANAKVERVTNILANVVGILSDYREWMAVASAESGRSLPEGFSSRSVDLHRLLSDPNEESAVRIKAAIEGPVTADNRTKGTDRAEHG